MIKIGIVSNPFDPRSWETFETENTLDFLVSHFGSWPATARIYDLDGFGDWTRAAAIVDPSVLAARDITPPNVPGHDFDRAIDRIARANGPIMVTIAPADPVTAIIAAVAVVAGIAAAFLFMPRIGATQRPQSANNTLSNRSNQPRVGARIEDIFGTVDSTPTLLAVPLLQFIDGQEVEECFMCIGRGAYEVSRVRDGDTNIASISGASVSIYGPGTSPNSGHSPEMEIGAPITSPVRHVRKLNEVNGQPLKPSNLNALQGEDSIRFVYPDLIETNDSEIDFTDYFEAGDAISVAQAEISGTGGLEQITTTAKYTSAGEIVFETIDPSAQFLGATTITIANASYSAVNDSSGVTSINVSGTYEIDSMDSTTIVLVDPDAVNSDWLLITDYPGDETAYRSADFSTPTSSDGINLNGNYTALAVTSNTITLNNPALVNSDWLDLVDVNDGFEFDGGVMPAGAYLARAGDGWHFNSSGVLTLAAANVARFDYRWNGSAWVLAGLLNEPAGTNLQLYSSDMTQTASAWTAVTGGGTYTATRMQEGAGTTARRDGTNIAFTSGTTYYFSAVVNEVAGSPKRYAVLILASAAFGANRFAKFDLAAGTVTHLASGTTAGLIDMGGGKWRIWIAATASASVSMKPQIRMHDVGNTSSLAYTTGDGSGKMDWQYVQVEADRLTSIIPTASTAITRPADVLTLDWGATYDIADGSISVRYTYGDDSTSTGTETVASGESVVPTSLASHQIKSVFYVPAGGETDYISPSLSGDSESWIGPFIVDLNDSQELLCNIVATNGLYTLSKKKGRQRAMTVGFVLEATPVNSSDIATGPAEEFPGTITGSAKDRTTVGISLFATPSFVGRCSIRMRRTTPTPNDDDYGAIVDEIRWRDAYGLADVGDIDFGDVTTVHSRTVATQGALSVKDRKLNMRVTRKLPARISGSTFGPAEATDSADDIIAAMCLDPYIGRLNASDVDFDSIYDTIADVADYFGSDLAKEFSYTFDDDDLSFEETLAIVADAVFCKAYRQGRVVRLNFERATEDSVLLFNARNILPGSQTRNVRFGDLDDHDGVDIDYTDPIDGASLTYSVPTDGAAYSPMSLERPGIRSDQLAYWHAWRARNKVRFQNTSIELDATQEGGFVVRGDRILVADRTRPGVLQGEVEDQDGVDLILSNDAVLDPDGDWVIFLQHASGQVEAIRVQSWVPGIGEDVNPRRVVLDYAASSTLSTDPAYARRATYMIVPVIDVQTRAFIVTEQELSRNQTVSINAVNYSFLYYQHDELVLWPNMTSELFFDDGPYRHDAVVTGTVGVIDDETRGSVASLTAAGSLTFPGFVSPASYTKVAWIKIDDLVGDKTLLKSDDGFEVFGFSGTDLIAGHDGEEVSAEWPEADVWHHAAVTYDADSGEGALYIDGALAASGPLSTRTPDEQTAFENMAGRVSDLRVWKRALTPKEVHEIYLSSQSAA